MGIQERKEREKEHRRDEIVDAAQAVFFEKGLQNSTMDEIAEAAELRKGTLYLYYKSKEDLYLSVMLRGRGVLRDMFARSISQSANPIDALQRIGDTLLCKTFFSVSPLWNMVWVSIALLGIDFIYKSKFGYYFVSPYDVFFGELIALLFFGSAWLVKSQVKPLKWLGLVGEEELKNAPSN